MAKFKEVNVCPPLEATLKCKHQRGCKKVRRKDFETMPGQKKKSKSYEDRRGETFAVRSYKLSRVHLHSISGGGKLPRLMHCSLQLYALRNSFFLFFLHSQAPKRIQYNILSTRALVQQSFFNGAYLEMATSLRRILWLIDPYPYLILDQLSDSYVVKIIQCKCCASIFSEQVCVCVCVCVCVKVLKNSTNKLNKKIN